MKYTERYTAKGIEKLKEYEAANGIYHAGDWRFCAAPGGVLNVFFNYEISDWDDRNNAGIFDAVIAETQKHGYNVDAEFLHDQVAIIQHGFKQNRFLPDRSGAVFSPISCNGIFFRFTPIEGQKQYIC